MIKGYASTDESMTGYISAVPGFTGKISVSVKEVPYYETQNQAGGTTVYIGSEVIDNGV